LRPEDSSSWLASYSDIVTLLLVFFIIFYILERNVEKNRIENLVTSVKKEIDEKALAQRFPHILGKEVLSVLRSINNSKSQNIILHDNSVSMVIRDVEFFASGSTNLMVDAKKSIKDSFLKLLPFKEKIRINVRGFTDYIPVSKTRNSGVWWKSNIELSVVRALRAREYLIELGFQSQNIYVTGEGSQKSYLLNSLKGRKQVDVDNKDIIVLKEDLERIVTFRIESI
jgi:chemotaxis protein MotB